MWPGDGRLKQAKGLWTAVIRGSAMLSAGPCLSLRHPEASRHRLLLTPTRWQYSAMRHFEHHGEVGVHRF